MGTLQDFGGALQQLGGHYRNFGGHPEKSGHSHPPKGFPNLKPIVLKLKFSLQRREPGYLKLAILILRLSSVLEGARQRLGGQLHRENEASTVKVKGSGFVGSQKGGCSTNVWAGHTVYSAQEGAKASPPPPPWYMPVHQPQRLLGID